jgi:hypothetical protein
MITGQFCKITKNTRFRFPYQWIPLIALGSKDFPLGSIEKKLS